MEVLKSEDIHPKLFDRFLSNSLIKTGYGLALGSLFSLMLRRRLWPIVFGSGYGFGFACSDYSKDLKSVTFNSVMKK